MATVTLADLLTPYTQATLRDAQYGVLENVGFPVTSWQSTSVPYVLAEANVACALDLANLVPLVAAGGLIELATGDWLTLLAAQNYSTDRTPALFTRRIVRLTNDSGAPVSQAANTVTIENAEGYEFSNEQAFSADDGEVAYVVFKAVEAGDESNDSTASWSLVTSLPGVTADEISGAPVIVTAGAPEESDEALRTRCREKWSTLGAGANSDAFSYWVKNTPGCPEAVTRVQIKSHTPLPGQVTAYAATASAPISDTATLGTVTQSGAGPAITLSGTPTQSIVGRVEIITGGALTTATFRYTIDGETYTDTLTTAATYAIGDTGVTLNFAAGTYVANEVYQWTSVPATTDVIQDYIDPTTHLGLAPNCTDFFIEPATSYTVTPVGVIYVTSAAYKSAIEAARGATLTDVCTAAEVGGYVYVEALRHAFMSLTGVVNVTISTPAADINLADGEVAVAGAITGLTVSVV